MLALATLPPLFTHSFAGLPALLAWVQSHSACWQQLLMDSGGASRAAVTGGCSRNGSVAPPTDQQHRLCYLCCSGSTLRCTRGQHI